MKENETLKRVVRILNDGEYHDGNTMGKQLIISRSAIWKSIKKLINYGVNIQSVKGKGYQLAEPLLLLDKNKIRRRLSGKLKQIPKIVIAESIASTNSYLKTDYSNKSIKICLAEQQTQGKGRLGRNWHSPFGQNIYFSCSYRLNKDISELAGLSLVVGLAVLKTLKEYGLNDNLFVKWPNDIVWNGKKIAGTLIEIDAETHGTCRVIIGVGINVNMLKTDNKKITQPWTSTQQILNTYADRNKIVAALIFHLINYIKQFEQKGFFYFCKEWSKHDYLLGKTILIKNDNKVTKGKVIKTNLLGHLMLKLPGGKLRAFSSGDTTIMK